MNTHADKTPENKSQSVANAISQRQSSSKSSFQFEDNRFQAVAQKRLQEQPIQKKADSEPDRRENNTGLPDTLKSGIEEMSGFSMDDVNVHYNSGKPAQLNAHAYAQGTDIHIGSGQEKHLPHEAWHVVQQKQGRVQPTTSLNGTQINDNVGLETEADVMGNKALQMKTKKTSTNPLQINNTIVQRVIVNSDYKGSEANDIEAYAEQLNTAVQQAWGLLIKTPAMGKFANLNGYTQLWVSKIKEFGATGKDPGGLHTAFGYAIESLVSGPLLPSPNAGIKVIQQGARGSTRPDLILQYNKLDIAWLDITASSSAGHIFTKTGGWEQSPSFAEITYPSIGTSDLLEMAKEAKENPEAEIGDTVNVEEYLLRKERAEKELEIKKMLWKEQLQQELTPVKKIGGPFVPDDGPPRRKKTLTLMQTIFGEAIPEKLAPHILAAVSMNSSTYGFRAGFPANASTGIAFLLDKPNPITEEDTYMEEEGDLIEVDGMLMDEWEYDEYMDYKRGVDF
ncbi:DUF4157 domain-containing protein [Tenacibaculum sp. TC6]|uniref:eCIS core domain-containing protein n=1 Tax=Tenacibaculum sp. TC6 TaxID=3423223 RepID=UPI003D366AB3